MMESPFLVHVIPGLAEVDANHPALIDAADELEADLRIDAPSALADEAVATDGTKGLIQDLILNIGGSGAAGGLAVRALRIWLERDRRRSLKVVHKSSDGAVLAEVELSGDGISTETLNRALSQIGWTPPTPPSSQRQR